MIRFELKNKSRFDRLLSLLDNYDRRLQYVSSRLSYLLSVDVSKQIKRDLDGIQELRDYMESIRVYRISGTDPAEYCAASVSGRVRLGDSSMKNIVVYFQIQNDESKLILEENNPWPKHLLPSGVSSRDISIHRSVSDDEYEHATQATYMFIQKNKPWLRSAGLNVERLGEPDTDKLQSVPDYMHLALRMEFGYGTRKMSFWSKAVKSSLSRLEDISEKDMLIQAALYDHLFTGHMYSHDFTKDDVRSSEIENKFSDIIKSKV